MTALIENTDSTFERPWYLKSRKLTNYHKNIVMPKNIGRGTSEILFPVVPKNNKFGWILKPFAFFWDEARDARSFVKGVSSINFFFRPTTFYLLKNRPTKEKQNIFPRVNSAYIIKYIAKLSVTQWAMKQWVPGSLLRFVPPDYPYWPYLLETNRTLGLFHS